MNGPRAHASHQDWEHLNADYLSRAFALIAARLEEMATAPASLPSPALTAALGTIDGEPPPALLLLRDAFQLSPFEVAVLALCAGFELDSAVGDLCGRAMGDPSRPWPTFALALSAFDGAAWDAVTAGGALRRWRLVEADRPFGLPLVKSALRCDERIVDFIKGLNQLDERLLAMATGVPPGSGGGDDAAVASLRRLWSASDTLSTPAMLFGAEASARLESAANAAAHCGRALFQIEARALPQAAAELDRLAMLWRREAMLLPLALLVEAGTEDVAAEAPLRRFIAKLDLPVAVSLDRGEPRLAEEAVPVCVAGPDATLQEATWREAMGAGAEDLAARLAGTYDLSLAVIRRIGLSAARDASVEVENEVWRECAGIVRPRLDAIAQRIEPRAGWADLVLPEAQHATLRQIADQVRLRRRVYDEWGYRAKSSRGLGVNALFAGESGTGKTMAAEVLAAELDISLYRIDLSAIVSKYIGETEKNLRQLFDAAERGGAMLLFDEADALFGKRSEVKDSHDRYANIEVNYLLQRIEQFTGLAVLATNMKSALDSAFLRRLRFVVEFPYPGPAERTALWRKAFPSEVPLEELDHAALGRINLTGGAIAAAAINAAFLAASERQSVGMRHVLRASRAELAKLNRPINEADFLTPSVLKGVA